MPVRKSQTWASTRGLKSRRESKQSRVKQADPAAASCATA